MLGVENPIIVGFVVVNTIVLGVLLNVFRPADHGFFGHYGFYNGWAICFGISGLFTGLAIFQLPWIVSIVAWFVVALVIFRLTTRQAIQMNIAQNLIYIALVFGFATVVR
jgi:hypothetical protein